MHSLLLGAIAALALTACVTGSDSGDPSAAAELPGDAGPVPEPPPSGSDAAPVPLGPLTDEDAQHALHDAYAQRLARSTPAGEDGQETVAVGDFAGFRFTVVKALVGKDDVSGDKQQAPDGLEVEVSGWYKKTIEQAGEETSACFSFDALTPLVRRPGAWVVPADWALTFTREDEEDCF